MLFIYRHVGHIVGEGKQPSMDCQARCCRPGLEGKRGGLVDLGIFCFLLGSVQVQCVGCDLKLELV